MESTKSELLRLLRRFGYAPAAHGWRYTYAGGSFKQVFAIGESGCKMVWRAHHRMMQEFPPLKLEFENWADLEYALDPETPVIPLDKTTLGLKPRTAPTDAFAPSPPFKRKRGRKRNLP